MNYIQPLVFDGQDRSLVVERAQCRRSAAVDPSLLAIAIPRYERRITNQRSEDRYRGVVSSAVLTWRGAKKIVSVANISASGLMVQAEWFPHIGEKVDVRFSGADPLVGHVRWVKDGRFGIDFGEPAIQLREDNLPEKSDGSGAPSFFRSERA